MRRPGSSSTDAKEASTPSKRGQIDRDDESSPQNKLFYRFVPRGSRRGYMYKGLFDHVVHMRLLEMFMKHGHKYNVISQELDNALSEETIRVHIQHCITYLNLSGYELPSIAYPLPFNLFDQATVKFITDRIDSLREFISSKKQKGKDTSNQRSNRRKLVTPDTYFMNIPDKLNINSVFYENAQYLDGDNAIVNEVIHNIQHSGFLTAKDILNNYFNINSGKAKFIKSNLLNTPLKHFLLIYKPHARLNCIVPRRKEQDVYNKWVYEHRQDVQHDPTRLNNATDTVPDNLNNDIRVLHLKQIICERRWDNTFKLQRLEDDLYNMNQQNKRQFRYSESTKIFAHCLLNRLGLSRYQLLLGIPEKNDTSIYDPRKINEILPSVSLLQQQRLPMITEIGVFKTYIQLCAELLQKLHSFDNLWAIMVDSVDLQANLSVCRQKGLIFGISGRVYKVSDVHSESIFKHLNAVKHLARKATLVLLCHGSNDFAIPVAYTTCVSETYKTVSKLLRKTLNSCKGSNINVQLLNSDGASYLAVKDIAAEFGIAGFNCVCHLGKNIRNPLLQDILHNRMLLVPIHTVKILSDVPSSDLIHLQCLNTCINFLTVDIEEIEEDMRLQIVHRLNDGIETVVFEGSFCGGSCDIYFSDEYESSFIYSKEDKKISFSIYSLENSLENIVFRCDGKKTLVNSTGHVVQKVSMDTIRFTYESSPEVQKIMSWEGMHCTDKMKESFMSDICSDAYLDILEKKFPQLPGIHKYLKIMNHIYHPSAKEESLDTVLSKLKIALAHIEEMRNLTKNFKGLYGVTDATYNSLVLNISGTEHMLQYLKKNKRSDGGSLKFSTRLLLTNRLEGLFGRCRLMMRRFTHFQFQMLITKLVTECLLFLNPNRTNSMAYGRKTHYLDYLDTKVSNREELSDIVQTMLSSFVKAQPVAKQVPFTTAEMRTALSLAEAFHMPKVKVLRDSYYGPRLNDLNKFIQIMNKPIPLDYSVIRGVNINEYITSEQKQLDQDVQLVLKATLKPLFVRPTESREYSPMEIVWTDLEWNNSSEIISIAAYHHESGLKFETLVKQRSVGRSKVHGIQLEMLQNAPSLLHALKEYLSFLKVLNADKVLLVAHYGCGADFPKLFKAIHSLGFKLDMEIELADTRYVFSKLVPNVSGSKNSLNLTALYTSVFPNRELYHVHNALADTLALHEVFTAIVETVNHEDVPAVYKYILSHQPDIAKAKYECFIKNKVYEKKLTKKRKRDHEIDEVLSGRSRKRHKSTKTASTNGVENDYVTCSESSDSQCSDDESEIISSTRIMTRSEQQFIDEHYDTCIECGEGGDLLLCDYCNVSIHLEHAKPPLRSVPKGEWVCHLCTVCSVCHNDDGEMITCVQCNTRQHMTCCESTSSTQSISDWRCGQCLLNEDQDDNDDLDIWSADEDNDTSDDYDGSLPSPFF